MNVINSMAEFCAISYSPYDLSSLEGERLLSVREDQRTTRAGFELNYLVWLSYLIHHRILELLENFSSKHPDDLPA